MVIEFLTFPVAADEREAWMAVEEQVWSRFLETRPGFIRKELWVDEADDHHVHAVIWWESHESWKTIGADTVAEVDERMGEWLRHPTERVYRVVRTG